MTLRGHRDAVTCLQFDSQRIVSGSLDCTLKFWDIHSGQCRNTIDWKDSEGHTGVMRWVIHWGSEVSNTHRGGGVDNTHRGGKEGNTHRGGEVGNTHWGGEVGNTQGWGGG